MFKPTTILRHETQLNSLAHCSNCGASMIAIGDNLCLPNKCRARTRPLPHDTGQHREIGAPSRHQSP